MATDDNVTSLRDVVVDEVDESRGVRIRRQRRVAGAAETEVLEQPDQFLPRAVGREDVDDAQEVPGGRGAGVSLGMVGKSQNDKNQRQNGRMATEN